MRGDGVPLFLSLDQFLEDQLVDAAVVHVDDLDLESADLQHFTFVRHARDLMQDQAGDGVEPFVVAEILAQCVGALLVARMLATPQRQAEVLDASRRLLECQLAERSGD